MGWRLRHRFVPVEVILVFVSFFFLTFHDFGLETALLEKQSANPGPCGFVFVDNLGDNISGAGKGVLHRFDTFARIKENFGFRRRIGRGILSKNQFRQGLQSFLPGDCRARPPLGPVR